MSKTRVGTETRSNDELIASIADRTRRQMLLALQDRLEPIDTTRLATHVAAAVTGEELVDVTRGDRDAFHVTLVHSHLPRLDDAGLVDWNRNEETVAATDHPALDDPRFRQLVDATPGVEETDDAAAEDWDAVLRAIQPARRRRVLSVLADAGGLERRALARRVLAREADVEPTTVGDDRLDDAVVSLRHRHVPALQRAGLVSVDGETVRYAGHPDLEAEHLAAEPFDLGRGDASDDRDDAAADATDEIDELDRATDDGSADVRTIDGRGDIIARGQSLFEAADEELFLMVTTDGLLEPECVHGLQDAIDRGVDVYVGSQTRAVRDLVREEVPGATIWEPQLDWLNLPPQREKLGRLVFADREAVMIGTLGERTDEGHRETAITGEGEDNSLVVLFRELLGSRLDHLDAQSEDFRSQIPL